MLQELDRGPTWFVRAEACSSGKQQRAHGIGFGRLASRWRGMPYVLRRGGGAHSGIEQSLRARGGRVSPIAVAGCVRLFSSQEVGWQRGLLQAIGARGALCNKLGAGENSGWWGAPGWDGSAVDHERSEGGLAFVV